MESDQREQRLNHGAKVGLAALGGDEVVVETQVQQGAAGMDFLVELGGGTHGCQRGGCVGAHEWGHAFAGWFAVFAAAWRGAKDAAHWDVVGNAHEGGVER